MAKSKPQQQKKKPVMLRLKIEDYQRIAAIAKREDRPIAYIIERLALSNPAIAGGAQQ